VDEKKINHKRESAKIYALTSTCMYAMLAPFLLFLENSIGVTSQHAHTLNAYVGLIALKCVNLSAPISMIISVFMMWSKYYMNEQYRMVRFFAILPLFFIILFVTVNILSTSKL